MKIWANETTDDDQWWLGLNKHHTETEREMLIALDGFIK